MLVSTIVACLTVVLSGVFRHRTVDLLDLLSGLGAAGIVLCGFGIYHSIRAPWLLHCEQEEEVADLQKNLGTEVEKNQQPEIKGEIICAIFDVAYRQIGQPALEGYVVGVELNLWNGRHVPTTIKEASLTVVANGVLHTTFKLSFEGNVQIGAARLENVVTKIHPQNPLKYKIHESGWLLFYVESLRQTVSNAKSQQPAAPAHLIPDVTLKLSLIDASGIPHFIEKTCDLERRSLQRNIDNIMKQFTVGV